MNIKDKIQECIAIHGLEKNGALIEAIEKRITPILEKKLTSLLSPRLLKAAFADTLKKNRPEG